MVKYARFMTVYLFSLATLTGILLGGAWMWLGFVVIYGVMILGDESLGDAFQFFPTGADLPGFFAADMVVTGGDGDNSGRQNRRGLRY